jgi:trk system potassium uptake protein TrkH
MVQFNTSFFVVGILLSILGAAMMLPMLVDYTSHQPDWVVFAVASGLTMFVGGTLILAFYQDRSPDFGIREAFVLTLLSWISIILFAMLPIYWSSFHISFIDALFETTSALTTTGATVVTGKTGVQNGLLLWTALLQWLGGIGIIVMAITILPFLKVGGMQLFRAEFSDRSEKIMPRLSQMTKAIVLTYGFFTLIGVISLWAAGMDPFDAICHSLTAISTGGLSTKDESIAFFDSIAIELVLIALMIVGGATMVLFIRTWHSSPKVLWQDMQFRGYIKILGYASFVGALWHSLNTSAPFLESLRSWGFTTVSLITTTGFTNGDYTLWGPLANVFFFFCMFIGGSTGSTSGGVKIFRFQVLSILTEMQLRQARHPHGIFLPRYNDQVLQESIIFSVVSFFALFGISYVFIALGLALFGLDLTTALSGSAAVLTNAGPGLGEIIGPSGNYALLPTGAKYLLIFGMLLGRLEFVTVFLIFSRSFWRS